MVEVLLGISLLFVATVATMSLSTNSSKTLGDYNKRKVAEQELARQAEELAMVTVKAHSFSELEALQNSSGNIDPAVLKGPAAEEPIVVDGKNYIIRRTITLKKLENSRRSADYVLIKTDLYDASDRNKSGVLYSQVKVLSN